MLFLIETFPMGTLALGIKEAMVRSLGRLEILQVVIASARAGRLDTFLSAGTHMERRVLILPTRKHYKRPPLPTHLHHFPSSTTTSPTPKLTQMSQRATSNTPKLLLSQIASDAEGQSRRDAVYYPDSPGLPQSFVHYGPSTTSPSAVGVSFPGAGTAGYGGPSNSTFTHYAGSLSVPSFSGTPAPHLNTMANTYDPVQQYAGDQNTSVTMSSSFNNFVPPQGYDLSSQIATAPTFHGKPHLVAAASSEDLSGDDLWTTVTIE